MRTIIALSLFLCATALAEPYSVEFIEGEADPHPSFRLSGPGIYFSSRIFSNYTVVLIPNGNKRLDVAHEEGKRLAEMVAEKLNSGKLSVDDVRALFKRSMAWSTGEPDLNKGIVPEEVHDLYVNSRLDEYRVRNYIKFRGFDFKTTPRIFGPGVDFENGFDMDWAALQAHEIIMNEKEKASFLADLALLLSHKKLAPLDIKKAMDEINRSAAQDKANRFVETIRLESSAIRKSIQTSCRAFYFGT